MIEPPRQPWRWAVLEVNDGVLVTVKKLFFDELLIRFVRQPCVRYLRGGPYLFRKEAREYSRRCETVKAMIVMQYAKFHFSRANQFNIRHAEP
jgi:hypothetical protein